MAIRLTSTAMQEGRGRYLRRSVERMIMKEDEAFLKTHKFLKEKNRKKVPKGATFGEYGRWVPK